MKIKDIKISFIGHTTFYFQFPGGFSLLTDPFFSDGFGFGKWEKRLSVPLVKPGNIKKCDAIFISHPHGDHYDPVPLQVILKNTKAKVYAPPEITEELSEKYKVPARRLTALTEGYRKVIGGVTLRAYAGFDASFDKAGRANKYALSVSTGKASLFFSGDCHQLPPAVKGKHFDAFFSWPHPKELIVKQYGRFFKFDNMILMHGDKFSPGKFYCNFDYKAEKARMEELLPNVKVLIPVAVKKV